MVLGGVRVAGLYDDSMIPTRSTDEAVGFDVYANNVQSRVKGENRQIISRMDEPVVIHPGDAVLFGIGVVIELPWGFEIQVRPRSGLANNYDIELSNSPGTVDPDFRGEVGVLLRNRGTEPFSVEKGMRIAQLIFSAVEIPDLVRVSVEELEPTKRGVGGFGSTALTGCGPGTGGYQAEIARVDRYFMGIVIATSELSDCIRGCERDDQGQLMRSANGAFLGQTRRFGCVIAKGLKVLSTGFNHQTPGPRCAEDGCMRDRLGIQSGTQIEMCRAVHAEQAAIAGLAGSGSSVDGATIYVNAEPCMFCARQIADLRESGLVALVILKGQYANNGLDVVRRAGIVIREVEM